MNVPSQRPVEVEADLELIGPDGVRLHITGGGARVRLAAADLRSLWRLGRRPQGFQPEKVLQSVHWLAARSNLAMDLVVSGHAVASVEPGGRASLVARAIGFPHVRIRLIGLLRALFVRHR